MASKPPACDAAAKNPRAILADVLCQVDNLGSNRQALPASLPKLKSGLRTDQDLADGDRQLGKVADRLAVIFNMNFEDPLDFCRSGERRRETKKQNQQ